MSEEIEKRVMEGGMEQIPTGDVDQVHGLTRHVSIGQGLKDLATLLKGGLVYWKQMVLSTALMITGGFFASVTILVIAPVLSLILDPSTGAGAADSSATQPTNALPFSWNLNSAGVFLLAWLKTRWQITDPHAQLTILCIALVGIVFVRSLCIFGGRWLAWSIQIKTFYQLQRRVFEHVLSQGLRFFHHNRVGSLISEIQTNVTAIVGPIQKILSDFMSSPFLLGVYFFLMYSTSPRLTLITLIAAVVTALLSQRIGVWLRKIKRSQLSQNALVTALMQEAFYGIRIVKAFAAEHYEADRYSRRTMDYLKLEQKHMLGKFAEEPTLALIGTVSLSIVLLQGASMVIQETLSFSGLILFLFVAYQSMAPLSAIGAAISSTLSVLGASERVIDILKEQPSVAEGPDHASALNQEIELKNVFFTYGDRPVLNNIHLTIRKGETIALVGPSGGGKSTLVDLLLRFYDPIHGEILLDGRNIRDFTQASYRRLFGIVPQETILFNDTVLNNIAYGRADATEAQVIDAARIANADTFIRKLPGGYHTFIGDRGLRVSGGERQRISIARAILSSPSVLIFDEATSALDSQSEKIVQDAIDSVIQNRTAVIIAHRLSTVRKASRILVIQDGQIAEEGRHEELLQKDGLYRRLHDTQHFVQEARI